MYVQHCAFYFSHSVQITQESKNIAVSLICWVLRLESSVHGARKDEISLWGGPKRETLKFWNYQPCKSRDVWRTAMREREESLTNRVHLLSISGIKYEIIILHSNSSSHLLLVNYETECKVGVRRVKSLAHSVHRHFHNSVLETALSD
jgi:hypothetical protein